MLKEELGLYSSIFNYSSIGYAIYDENFKLHKVNNTFTQFVNKPKDKVLGTSIVDYISAKDYVGFNDTIRILLKEKDTRNIQYIARSVNNNLYFKIISNIMKLDGKEYIFRLYLMLRQSRFCCIN